MFKNEYTLTVDIKKTKQTVVPTFVQYDSAELVFKILNDGKKYDLTGFTKAELFHKKPDGTITSGIATIEGSGMNQSIRYIYKGSEMSEVGFVETSLAIHSSTKKVSIQPFKVLIVADMSDEYASPANPEFGRLQVLIATVETLRMASIEATNNANAQANYATVQGDYAKQQGDIVQSLVSDWKFADSHNMTTQYKKNNMVSFNGSTYIAIKDNIGIYPVGDTSDAVWRVVARKGADGTGVVVLHKDAFIATANQKIFTLSNRYDQLQTRIHLIIGGVPQYSPESFFESSSNTVTLNAGVPAGTDITAIYFGNAPAIVNDLQLQITGLNDIIQHIGLEAIRAAGDHAKTQGDFAKTATNEANIATTNANAKATLAQTSATNADAKAILANDKATLADGKASLANTAATTANTKIGEMNAILPLVQGLENKGVYDNLTAYKKNNTVRYNGSSYQALVDSTGKLPTDTLYWSLLAQRGVDGDGAVSTVNGLNPDLNGNVQVPLPETHNHTNKELLDNLTDSTGKLQYKGKEIGTVISVNGQSGAVIGLATETQLQGKVDKVAGKQLSTENYSTAEKAKLVEVDSKVGVLTGNIDGHGTQLTNHESRLGILESEKRESVVKVDGLNREVAYLKLQQETKNRLVDERGVTFADDMSGNGFGMTFDKTASNNIIIRNGKMLMNNIETVSKSAVDKVVVNQAYSTAGSGGRKLVRLDNGWLVSVMSKANYIYLYVDRNDGVGWVSLCHAEHPWLKNEDASIVTRGSKVYLLCSYDANGLSIVNCGLIDALTQLNVNVQDNLKTVDQGQTKIGNVSLAIDLTNGHLHAAWASKNATYPNSFNIRYSKSVDGGVTWSVVEQFTSQISGEGYTQPTICITDGKPLIISKSYNNTNYLIETNRYNGSSWSGFKNIYVAASYAQSSPSSIVDKDGVIHIAWHGRDALHPSADYIRYSKSIDGGATWSTMKKLNPGTEPSISTNLEGQVFITYFYSTAMSMTVRSDDKGDTWSGELVGKNIAGKSPSTLADNTLSFSRPLVVAMSSSSVLFSGDWSEKAEVPKTTASAVYNLLSTDYVGAFMKKIGSVTATAFLNNLPMGSDLLDNEYLFDKMLPSKAPATLRIELSRPTVTGNEADAVTRILGGRS